MLNYVSCLLSTFLKDFLCILSVVLCVPPLQMLQSSSSPSLMHFTFQFLRLDNYTNVFYVSIRINSQFLQFFRSFPITKFYENVCFSKNSHKCQNIEIPHNMIPYIM